MLSGILGLIVIGFKRIPRHKLRQHLFTFLRINSSFVTSVAAVCTLLASTFAVLHLITIMSPSTVCTPSRLLIESSECTCRYGETASNVTISTNGFNLDGTYYRWVKAIVKWFDEIARYFFLASRKQETSI